PSVTGITSLRKTTLLDPFIALRSSPFASSSIRSCRRYQTGRRQGTGLPLRKDRSISRELTALTNSIRSIWPTIESRRPRPRSVLFAALALVVPLGLGGSLGNDSRAQHLLADGRLVFDRRKVRLGGLN